MIPAVQGPATSAVQQQTPDSTNSSTVDVLPSGMCIAPPKNPVLRDIFEDVRNRVSAGVGETPLYRARPLEAKLGLAGVNVYIKPEWPNPTDTHKDRLAVMHILDALSQWLDNNETQLLAGGRAAQQVPPLIITCATCGNYGAALARATQIAAGTVAERLGINGTQAAIFMSAGTLSTRLDEIRRYGAQINFVDGLYEKAIEASREYAHKTPGVYDANPGERNSELQINSLKDIAREIVEKLSLYKHIESGKDESAPVETVLPNFTYVPVSNGTTAAAIGDFLISLKAKSNSNVQPRLIAGTCMDNPVGVSFVSGSPECLELRPDEVQVTKDNELLADYRSADGNRVLDAVSRSNGAVIPLEDADLRAAADLLNGLNFRNRHINGQTLKVLTESSAGLAAFQKSLDVLRKLHEQDPNKYPASLPPGTNVVIVVTGEKNEEMNRNLFMPAVPVAKSPRMDAPDATLPAIDRLDFQKVPAASPDA